MILVITRLGGGREPVSPLPGEELKQLEIQQVRETCALL